MFWYLSTCLFVDNERRYACLVVVGGGVVVVVVCYSDML